jgi:hypothetical protein
LFVVKVFAALLTRSDIDSQDLTAFAF